MADVNIADLSDGGVLLPADMLEVERPGSPNTSLRVVAPIRPMLTANRTYYVDGTSGSDSNDGLSSGAGAFATIQKAVDTVAALDLSIYNVTINVADGTYSAGATLKTLVGAGVCNIVGNASTPENCVISSTSSCFAGIFIGSYTLSGFELTTTVGQPINISDAGARLSIVGPMRYGTTGSVAHILVQNFGVIEINASYTVIAAAPAHLCALYNGRLSLGGTMTITVSGTPAFSAAFCRCEYLSFVRRGLNVTISGAATGKRYLATGNAVIDVNAAGANYFPGNVAGDVATGGQYL